MLRRSALIAAALLASLAGPAQAARARVAVLKSDSLEPYARLASALTAELDAEVVEVDCRGDKVVCEEEARGLESRAAVVVALGPIAAVAASRLERGKVLFAMVPSHERYRALAARNVAGIALTAGFRAQLEVLRSVAPSIKRVGVVFDPRRSAETVDRVAEAASELGLKLTRVPVEDGDARAAVKSLPGKADALLLVPDPVIASEDAFSALVKTCNEERLPSFALTETMVKEGMLVALSPDAASQGMQAARLARRMLDGASAASVGVVAPEGIEISVNLATARRIGLGDPALASLLRFAARQRYPLRPVE